MKKLLSLVFIFYIANTVIAQEQWQHFHSGNSGLSHDYISAIAFDGAGAAWITTWGGGLNRYVRDQWQYFTSNSFGERSEYINDLKIDRNGRILMATDGSGILMWSAGKWEQINPTQDNLVLLLAIDPKNSVWIGTYGEGLLKYNGNKIEKIWIADDYYGSGVNDIVLHGEDIWIATRSGVLQYSKGKWKEHKLKSATSNLARDSKGNIWALLHKAGTVARFDGKDWTYITASTPESSLPSSYIQAFYIDKADRLYLPDGKGNLLEYHNDTWQQVDIPGAKYPLKISSIVKDKEDNLWIGTVDQGLFVQRSEQLVEQENIDTIRSGKVRDRKVEFQHEMKVRNSNVTLEIWDNHKEDGDIFSLNFNGRWLVKEQLLTNKPFILEVELSGEDNYIVLHADDLGAIPPNTAAIRIVDGKTKKTFILNSDMANSGTIKIYYDPEQ